MELAITIFVAIYVLFSIFLWLGWEKTPLFEGEALNLKDLSSCRISVMIPIRNEAQGIGALLEDLAQQDFPKELFEVWVINDQSEDNSVEIVEALQSQLDMVLKLIHLPSAQYRSPKKEALSLGIAQAKGELIVCTDGDCRVGSEWLSTFWQFYQVHQAKFISGPVRFHRSSRLFERLQCVEFASLVGTGASSLAWNLPSMSNGANLAYPRKVFEELGGYEGIKEAASGDDEFWMHKIAKAYPRELYFLKSPKAIVSTGALKNFRAFFQQRQRWGSKWKYSQNWSLKILAFYIFVLHLSLIIGLILSFLGFYPYKLFLIQLGAKFLVELGYLSQVLRFLSRSREIVWIPIVQIIYPFYVSLMGLAANQAHYEWKGRKLQ